MTGARVVSTLPAEVAETVVTVGTFDGVHRGHRDLLSRVADRAAASGRKSVAVTFEPHPLEVINPAAAPLLLTLHEEKLELLGRTGVDFIAVLPFTPSLQALDAEQFVEQVLLGQFRMQELLVGYDHGLGRGREGSAEQLRTIGEARGFAVEVVAPVQDSQGRPISSTLIRRAVAGGDLAHAAASLGRAYSVRSRVVRGAGRGRTIGIPTLNMPVPSPRKLLPPEGVYAVGVETPSGTFGGMMNLGPRPTFGDERVTLEAHLFDTSGDWYDASVRVDFVARLRDTRRFADVAALREQLARDEADARRALTPIFRSDTLHSFPPPLSPSRQ